MNGSLIILLLMDIGSFLFFHYYEELCHELPCTNIPLHTHASRFIALFLKVELLDAVSVSQFQKAESHSSSPPKVAEVLLWEFSSKVTSAFAWCLCLPHDD